MDKCMNIEDEYVRHYQSRFAKWIKSDKWGYIAEKLSDTHMNIIKQVMNAKKDGDCSWIIWHQCNNVLDKIRKIAKQIN